MPDVCTEHSGVCVNIANLKEQTETNTKDIKTLSDAVIKLTTLVEAMLNPTSSGKQKFWDENTKKYALKLGFVLIVIIVLALVGTNIIENVKLTDVIK